MVQKKSTLFGSTTAHCIHVMIGKVLRLSNAETPFCLSRRTISIIVVEASIHPSSQSSTADDQDQRTLAAAQVAPSITKSEEEEKEERKTQRKNRIRSTTTSGRQ